METVDMEYANERYAQEGPLPLRAIRFAYRLPLRALRFAKHRLFK